MIWVLAEDSTLNPKTSTGSVLALRKLLHARVIIEVPVAFSGLGIANIVPGPATEEDY